MSSGPKQWKFLGFWMLVVALLPLPALAAPRPRALTQEALAAQDPQDPVVETPPPDDNVVRGTTLGVEPPPPRAIEINVWGRLGNNIAKPGAGQADAFVDAEVDLLLGGRVHQYVGWQADFVATYGPGNYGPGADNIGRAQILDLIVKFELAAPFNVWFGRMLVPSDRSNLSGPWFMSPWNYPGGYVPGAVPVGPRAGAFGRSDGVTLWGELDGGVVKYFAGVYDLGAPADSPLFSGRLNLSLGNPEPGYYHSSTYYGTRDLAAIGVNAQYKKNGSLPPPPMSPEVGIAPPATYSGFSADLLLERTRPGLGTIDLEAALYFFTGAYEPIDYHYYALLSFLTPKPIGLGRVQPMIRFQQARPSGGGPLWNIFDVQVGYAVEEHAARLALGYQHLSAAGLENDLLFLGFQIQR
jgi:hypothetical protein